MKAYLMTDDRDLLLGFQLAGVSGEYVQPKAEEVKGVFERLIRRDDIGVLIMTRNLFLEIQEDVLKHKQLGRRPLTVTLPNRGQGQDDFLLKFVSKATGIKGE